MRAIGRLRTTALAAAACMSIASAGLAQRAPFERLPAAQLDAAPPSARVSGAPGAMTIRRAPCRTLPLNDVRRRIVDIAVQEWGFFGFVVDDRTNLGPDGRPRSPRVRPRRPYPAESARVAASIAGYWSVTPQGSWILGAQNRAWSGRRGGAARWRYPWSAAFVSWVMCEAGLADTGRFRRAVAHHGYIDQALRATAAEESPGAFTAHDMGRTTIEPGDLLCSARRPAYRSIAERRRQIGVGARTHCDIVVQVDDNLDRILAIGGNVRGTVALKLMPARRDAGGNLRPGAGRRPLFAHLKLRAAPIGPDAFDRSPTMRAARCADELRARARLAAAHLAPAGRASQC